MHTATATIRTLTHPPPSNNHQQSQPLTAKEFNFSPSVVDCLETFRMIAEMGEESLGAYVISMSKRPSDVLAVKLLMKEFGLKR